MRKQIMTLTVESNTDAGDGMSVLTLSGPDCPAMLPGQFVEVEVPGAGVLLRRPISVFDSDTGRLSLLVRAAGRATDVLAHIQPGTALSVVGPLGRGFAMDGRRPLLVGGGVGLAPLYLLARRYSAQGVRPRLIAGFRTAPSQLLKDLYARYAEVTVCTDDGSEGIRGNVCAAPALQHIEADMVQVCGPLPMMKAVAGAARSAAVPCQVSLENKMACGLGACLCCVENTTTGNRCVCTDGPVFNINELTW